MGKKHGTVSRFYFIEYGQPVPKQLSKKLGTNKKIASTETILGYVDYIDNGHGEDPLTSINQPGPIARENQIEGYLNYMADGHGENKETEAKWQRDSLLITSHGDIKNIQGKKLFDKQLKAAFSKEGNICWVPIISLSNYGIAEEFNLMKDEDYSAIIHDFLPRWFRKIGLNPDNMIWAAEYHNNTDNPHLHFIFTELDQTRHRGKLTKAETNAFRNIFTSRAKTRARELGLIKTDVERSNQLHKTMDERRKLLRQRADAFLAKKIDETIEMSVLKLYANLDRNMKGGSLKYGSANMASFRKDIDKITDRILEHPDIKGDYENLKQSWRDLDKFALGDYLDDADSYQKNEERKLYTTIGNLILQGKKDFDQNRIDILKDLGLITNETTLNYMNQRDYDISINGIDIDHEISKDEFSHIYETKEIVAKAHNEKMSGSIQDYFRILEENTNFIIYNDPGINQDRFTHSLEIKSREPQAVIEYTNDILKKYCRCVLNNLQDGKTSISIIEKEVKAAMKDGDIFNFQDLCRNYVYANRDQPDNPYYRDSTFRAAFNHWIGSNRPKSEQFSTNNRFVFETAKNLFSRNSVGQKTRNEIDKYWDRKIKEDEREKDVEREGVTHAI